MDVLAALTDNQKAIVACIGMLLGSTVVLSSGFLIGRWTGRNIDSTENDVLTMKRKETTSQRESRRAA